jgi:hypothetical protein
LDVQGAPGIPGAPFLLAADRFGAETDHRAFRAITTLPLWRPVIRAEYDHFVIVRLPAHTE